MLSIAVLLSIGVLLCCSLCFVAECRQVGAVLCYRVLRQHFVGLQLGAQLLGRVKMHGVQPDSLRR